MVYLLGFTFEILPLWHILPPGVGVDFNVRSYFVHPIDLVDLQIGAFLAILEKVQSNRKE